MKMKRMLEFKSDSDFVLFATDVVSWLEELSATSQGLFVKEHDGELKEVKLELHPQDEEP